MSAAAVLAHERPFPGMRPFESDEAELFFGQEARVNEVLDRLGKYRLVTVIGDSGCGKSSLVKAGLIPRLLGRRRSPQLALWRIAVSRPGKAPLANLAEQLEERLDSSAASIEATLRLGSFGLLQAIRESNLPAGRRVLIVIDQFEELFRYSDRRTQDGNSVSNLDEAALFVKHLLSVTEANRRNQDAVPVYVVLTMRSEYLGDCSNFFGLAEAINDGAYLIPKMSRHDIEDAIRMPLEGFDAEIDNELVQVLLNETEIAQQDGLPLLQHSLRRIWDRASPRGTRRLLRLKDFQQRLEDFQQQSTAVSGDAEIAATLLIEKDLQSHLDGIVAGRSEADKNVIWKMFRQLGEFDAKSRLIRRSPDLERVRQVCEVDEERLLSIVNLFRDEAGGSTFLMPPRSRDEALISGQEPLDISHESLLRRWPRLRAELEQEAKDADEFRALADRAYRGSDRLGPAELKRVQNWVRDFRPGPVWAERYGGPLVQKNPPVYRYDYNAAKRHLEDSAKYQRKKRWLTVFGVLGTLIIVGLLIFILWHDQVARRRTQDEKDLLNAIAETSTKSDLRSLISAEALRVNPQNIGARATLLQTLLSNSHLLMDLRGHTDEVRSIRFSPDGSMLASASADGKIVLWSTNTGRPLKRPLDAHAGGIGAIAFSPDSKLLASGGDDNAVRLWDTATGKEVGEPMPGHRNPVRAVAFHPDGDTIASAAWDGTIRLWSARTRSAIGPALRSSSNGVTSVSFNPKGRELASAGTNGLIQIWDLKSRKESRRLRGHIGRVWAVVYSPDGSKLASCGSDETDETIRIWSADNYRPLVRPIAAHRDSITSLAFSPDGRMLASVSADKTVRLWNALDGSSVGLPLSGHSEPILSVDFSPDGNSLATAGLDKTVVLWSVDEVSQLGTPRFGQFSSVWSVAASPDGRVLATAGDDGKVILWDVASRRRLGIPVDAHNGAATGVAFHPDGTLLASVGMDGKIQLWDVATGTSKRDPFEADAALRVVTFSPKGDLVAAAGDNYVVEVWETNGKRLRKFGENAVPAVQDTADAGVLHSLVFSPDGRFVVAGGSRGFLKAWDVSTGKEEPLRSGSREIDILALAFLPGQHELLSAGSDNRIMVRAWLRTATPPRLLAELPSSINSLAISADGKTIFAGTERNSIVPLDSGTGRFSGEPLILPNGTVAINSLTPIRGGGLAAATADRTVLWNANNFKASSLLTGHVYQIQAVAAHDRSGLLVSAGNKAELSIFDLKNGTSRSIRGTVRDIHHLAFDADGKYVVATGCKEYENGICKNGGIDLFAIGSDKPVWSISPPGGRLDSAVFTVDGQTLITGSDDGNIRFWDPQRGQEVGRAIKAHSDTVKALAISPDGRTLASGGNDHLLKLWDVSTRQPLGRPITDHTNQLRGLAFAPKDSKKKLLASSDRDRLILLWNVADRSAPRKVGVLAGHDGSVQALAFTPDGKTLVSGSLDTTVRLWDVESATAVGALQGHTAEVEGVAITDSGNSVISGALDGLLYEWQIDPKVWMSRACSIIGQNLTGEEWSHYLPGHNPTPLCVEASVRDADWLALTGKLQDASKRFIEAAHAADQSRDLDVLNDLCWYGALDGLAAEVLNSCNAAVQLGREDRPFYEDARGVARSLSGDYAGAAADFADFLNWSDTHRSIPEYMRTRRRDWIRMLKAGQNPFTPALRGTLRTEASSSR